MERTSIGPAEHHVVVLEGAPEHEPHLELPLAVLPQGLESSLVQGNQASAAPGLGRAGLDRPAALGALLRHHDPTRVEVDVPPAQAGELTAAQARGAATRHSAA